MKFRAFLSLIIDKGDRPNILNRLHQLTSVAKIRASANVHSAIVVGDELKRSMNDSPNK